MRDMFGDAFSVTVSRRDVLGRFSCELEDAEHDVLLAIRDRAAGLLLVREAEAVLAL